MSSTPPPPTNQPAKKDFDRDSRLSFKKFGEHQLRREFKDIAVEKCRTEINAFGKCAQENGLMVVWSCRHLNKGLNACMAINNSKEAFEKYKEENQDALIAKTPGMNPSPSKSS
jgi:hypothetical protein